MGRIWKCAILTAAAVLLIVQAAFAAQMLEEGNSGETVMVLTRRLSELGYIAEPTNTYGDSVASAVGDFQTANGLERTGIADVATQQVMYSDDAVTRQAYMASFIKKYHAASLKLGDGSNDVKRLQTALGALGYYSGTADGLFGEGTRRAVADYQRANGISITGTADKSTLIRLFEGESVSREAFIESQTAAKGDAGAHVRSIQDRLRELGYFKGDLTGTYGEMTERAVARFQTANALTRTGVVSAETYVALFSDAAVSAEGDGSLYPGDTGDEVFSLQMRLAELGYFDGTANGTYARATETAVMLFRAANGLPISVDATSDMLTALYEESAVFADALADSVDDISADTLAAICRNAREMLGEDFSVGEDELFPGFGFTRYVFATAGVSISEPGQIIGRTGQKAYSANDFQPGDVVVLGRGDAEQMTLTFSICVEYAVIAYVDPVSGKVSSGSIDDMDYESAYVWDFGAEN